MLADLIREPSLPRLCGTAGPPDQVRSRRRCVWRMSANIRCHQARCSRTWSGCPVFHACAALLGRRVKPGGDVGVCWGVSANIRRHQPRCSRTWSASPVSHVCAALLGRRIKFGGDVCVYGGRRQTSVAIGHDARGLDPRAQSPTPARHCWAAGSSPAATSWLFGCADSLPPW